MEFDSPSTGFLFSQLRDKREGVQFERILRALSFILYQWCQYPGKRKPLYGHNPSFLTAIEFDKLASFVFRLWNELNRVRSKTASRTGDLASSVDEQMLVTFPSPFLELPGKHGRGPARFDGKADPIYILDSIYALQDEGIYYFDITPPTEDPRNPTNHRTTVTSGMKITDPNRFLEGFDPGEIEILKDVANSVRHLGPSEIRALGTHENHKKTVEDISKEFRDMAPHQRKVAGRLLRGESFLEASRDLLEYADEAWRKSNDERRGDYRDAYGIMMSEIGDPEIRGAFASCQTTMEQMWGPPLMTALAKSADKIHAVAQCDNAIAIYQAQSLDKLSSQTRASQQFRARWKEGVEGIEKLGLSRLPKEIDDIFTENTKTIVPSIRQQLAEMTETKYV